MKVHLIDGTYELFRAWFGAPSARDARGREVGATRALLGSLNKFLREAKVTHVACAFDHVIESFRNRLFEGYKTGEGLPPELTGQFELAERATRALGIVVWPMVELEADDALATGARVYAEDPRVEQILLVSPDKDLAQCVDEQRVVCLDRARERLLDEAGVVEKFGVPPASIPDYLALVGDSADGIPGIRRWGARSASTVLARYGDVESIPENAASWDVSVRGAPALARELRAAHEAALLYKRLATLRTDAEIQQSVDDLAWHGAIRAELVQVAEEIGERTLLQRVVRWRD